MLTFVEGSQFTARVHGYLDDAEYKDLVAKRKGVGVVPVAAAASRP